MDCSSFSSSFLVFVFAYNMPDFGGSKTLFRIRYQHSLTFLPFRGTIYIRESREYALKSTEPSRDDSQCKARHISMPGFVGSSKVARRPVDVGFATAHSIQWMLVLNRPKRGRAPHFFFFLSFFSLTLISSRLKSSCKRHCHLS